METVKTVETLETVETVETVCTLIILLILFIQHILLVHLPDYLNISVVAWDAHNDVLVSHLYWSARYIV